MARGGRRPCALLLRHPGRRVGGVPAPRRDHGSQRSGDDPARPLGRRPRTPAACEARSASGGAHRRLCILCRMPDPKRADNADWAQTDWKPLPPPYSPGRRAVGAWMAAFNPESRGTGSSTSCSGDAGSDRLASNRRRTTRPGVARGGSPPRMISGSRPPGGPSAASP